MSQNDLVISNQSFPSFRTDLNSALQAIYTSHSGTSTPSGASAGTIWLDTTSATTPTLKYYDGTDNISLATIDHVGNTVNWLDSTVSITGLSTTATATVLTLTDSASTSTVNLIIDNQKEIRFSETTANGVNYVGFKAPASLSADKIWILPSADGSAGQFLKTDGAGNLSFSSDLPTTSFTGATVETSIADSDLVLIYDDSATAVRKMTKANLVAGIGASAGQVIQVVQTVKTDTFTHSSTTFTDVTGLSVSITPASASNTILVMVDLQGSGGHENSHLLARLLRGSTVIYAGDTSSNRTSGFYTAIGSNLTSSESGSGTFLDSPNTTSATTYKIQIRADSTTAVYINRTYSDTDSGTYLRGASSITVMEIAA